MNAVNAQTIMPLVKIEALESPAPGRSMRFFFGAQFHDLICSSQFAAAFLPTASTAGTERAQRTLSKTTEMTHCQGPAGSNQTQSSRKVPSECAGSRHRDSPTHRTSDFSTSSSQIWLLACTSGFGTLQLFFWPACPGFCGRFVFVWARIPCPVE